MKTSFTPGPWQTADAHGQILGPELEKRGDSEGYRVLAQVHGMATKWGKANASLISAAPELFAALEDLVAQIVADGPLNIVKARAAIRKAASK